MFKNGHMLVEYSKESVEMDGLPDVESVKQFAEKEVGRTLAFQGCLRDKNTGAILYDFIPYEEKLDIDKDQR